MVEMTQFGRIGLVAVMVLVVAFSVLESAHFIRFGHLVPLGLHADVVASKGDYGIDGISKVYEARLTNYGIILVQTTACDFIDDTLSHGTIVGYVVQKWDPVSRTWENVFESDESSFCHPYPLGMAEAQVITKRLWPSQSISTGEEATAARNVFAIGDRARFVVLAGKGLALPTDSFSIDEHPTNPEVPYRVRH